MQLPQTVNDHVAIGDPADRTFSDTHAWIHGIDDHTVAGIDAAVSCPCDQITRLCIGIGDCIASSFLYIRCTTKDDAEVGIDILG